MKAYLNHEPGSAIPFRKSAICIDSNCTCTQCFFRFLIQLVSDNVMFVLVMVRYCALAVMETER